MSARVPFMREFAEAVAEKSKVTLIDQWSLSDLDQRKIIIIVSNGEDDLRNQKVICDFKNKNRIVFSAAAQEKKVGEYEIAYEKTAELTGLNKIACRVETYEEIIFLKQQKTFLGWAPKENIADNLQRNKIRWVGALAMWLAG